MIAQGASNGGGDAVVFNPLRGYRCMMVMGAGTRLFFLTLDPMALTHLLPSIYMPCLHGVKTSLQESEYCWSATQWLLHSANMSLVQQNRAMALVIAADETIINIVSIGMTRTEGHCEMEDTTSSASNV